MANLPAVQNFPYYRESEEYKAGARINLNGYIGIVAFSICAMAAGVVAGVEQGRKPMFVAQSEVNEAAQLLTKLTAVEKSIVDAYVPNQNLRDFLIKKTSAGLEIHFGSSAMFGVGSANVRPDVEKNISELAQTILKSTAKPKVKIETYTDDAPMAPNSFPFPSNWELSGARAAKILRVFETAGIPAENLTFAGLGETQPLLPNRTSDGKPIAENRMKNRRVVIYVGNI